MSQESELKHFSESYDDARAKFLDAARGVAGLNAT